MITIKKRTIPSRGEDVEKLDPQTLYIVGRYVKCYSHFEKQFGSFLKLKYELAI